MKQRDERFMARVLELAARGGHEVLPNPQVGALVCRGDEVLAEGFHARFGGPHAEREAFAAVRAAGHDPRGATLYVNLEPCSHHGKTPPCVDAVLESGVGRVVVAQRDPNPLVDGRGLAALQARGIEVTCGVLELEARRLNAGFNKFMLTQRPLVTAKWAMSLDGRIATRRGDSKWISGAESRRWVHLLRGRVDAVVVGRGTAEADDPQLTRRDAPGRDPARVVFDSKGRLPDHLQLLSRAGEHTTYLYTTEATPRARRDELRRKGVNVLVMPREGERVDLRAALDDMGRRGWQRILLEGGAELLGTAFEQDLVDHLAVFVAPKIIAGARALSPVGGEGPGKIVDCLASSRLELERFGDDVLLQSWIHDW